MSVVHTSDLDDSIYALPDDVIHNGEMWAGFPDPEPWNPCILTLGELRFGRVLTFHLRMSMSAVYSWYFGALSELLCEEIFRRLCQSTIKGKRRSQQHEHNRAPFHIIGPIWY